MMIVEIISIFHKTPFSASIWTVIEANALEIPLFFSAVSCRSTAIQNTVAFFLVVCNV